VTLNRILRSIARAPILLYEWHLGWLLDHRFLMLMHRGRRSGSVRRTVLEVIAHNGASATVISGFGARSDWFLNVEANPNVIVEIGSDRYRATAQRLADDEAASALQRYEREHRLLRPLIHALISRLVGWHYSGTTDQRYAVVRKLPIVALIRRDGSSPAPTRSEVRRGGYRT
jgi:deazaflavin-dependent oxidoreductase (nitroreductase family)